MSPAAHDASRREPEKRDETVGSAWGISSMHPGKSPSTNVLVVDDEALIRWSLAESLTKAGYHVLEAEDRESALGFFEPAPAGVCVVLLDLRLPDSQDLGLLRQIRRRSPACRVIIMTAHGTPELVDEAMRMGAFRVVDKPFDLDLIVGLVGEAVGTGPH